MVNSWCMCRFLSSFLLGRDIFVVFLLLVDDARWSLEEPAMQTVEHTRHIPLIKLSRADRLHTLSHVYVSVCVCVCVCV